MGPLTRKPNKPNDPISLPGHCLDLARVLLVASKVKRVPSYVKNYEHIKNSFGKIYTQGQNVNKSPSFSNFNLFFQQIINILVVFFYIYSMKDFFLFKKSGMILNIL